MKKINSYISTFFIVFIVGFLTLIVYVSLLGDNHKINFAVNQYFIDIKNQDYDAPCTTVNSENRTGIEDCYSNNFLLETAFLIKFGLLEVDDYSIDIKRSHFWIPWVTDDTVSVSIALIPKRENFLTDFLQQKDVDYIIDFMEVKKESNLWTVQKVDADNIGLSEIMKQLKSKIDFNKYITKTENGYILNRAEINPKNLSPIDRRLFEYSMDRLSNL